MCWIDIWAFVIEEIVLKGNKILNKKNKCQKWKKKLNKNNNFVTVKVNKNWWRKKSKKTFELLTLFNWKMIQFQQSKNFKKFLNSIEKVYFGSAATLNLIDDDSDIHCFNNTNKYSLRFLSWKSIHHQLYIILNIEKDYSI